jgi:hypothetical protein
MKTFAKMIVAAIVAVFMARVLIMHGASDNLVICTLFATGIAVSGLLGVFDMPERTKHDSIRHKTGRNYGQAAVFIGTACLFVGTPQECDDLCDDLWHHGQQARVEMLTGEETFNVI